VGEILIAQTERGLCWLGFAVDGDRSVPVTRMKTHWPKASFYEDAGATAPSAQKILCIWAGTEKSKLNLHLYGTNFQLQVWQALMKIPCGSAVSYQMVASQIVKAKYSRAVGSAVGANPVSLLIPCHRVIQSSGIVENYEWGTPRKKLILALEGQNVAH
jgi:AraC family transcriptional regulator of adaptative response/methylated-DNA-[protein]-cysteine methyltransferase